MNRKIFFLCLLLATGVVAQMALMRSNIAIGKQSDGRYLLTTNQLIRPWGEQMPIQGRPVALAFDPGFKTLAVLNFRGVAILDASTSAPVAELKSKSTSYAGLAYSPDGKELWASEATRPGPDSILVAELNDLGKPMKESRIALAGHPVPVGIAFAGDRTWVAFSRNNSVAVINAKTHQVQREIETGMAPFSVAYSKKQNLIFVSNRAGRRPKKGDVTGPTSGAVVVADAKTGATTSGTITIINAATFATKEIDVGLAPSEIALNADESLLAVANGHSDTVSLIDTKTLARADVKIPSYPAGVLGSQPIGVQWANDGSLYVAAGGINAIVVVKKTSGTWNVAGMIPSGWFPSAIAVAKDGGLRIANVKGVGNNKAKNGTFNTLQHEGSIESIPPPLIGQLTAGMRETALLNAPQLEPAGGVRNVDSLGIQHVLLIIKENRTYDQVLGDMPKGNGDPSLTMFGKDVTPNHHALADQYVLVDNFHTGGAISFDGHHWLMQGFVSDYVERAFGASPRGYAWNMNDSLTISPTGFFWQSAKRPLDVRIYGEFCTAAKFDPVKDVAVDMNEQDQTWGHYWNLYKSGNWRSEVGCKPGVPALAPIMSAAFPFGSTNITDQMRAEVFISELDKFNKSGKMPNLMVMTLDSDHTNGTKPGSPTPRAMVADDDLALGRIVEAVSKSKFWSKTLILVTEDDAQNGYDHVDGHRTIALAIGPHVRRNAVVSDFYNHTSMIRTIQDIFRIAPATRHMASARAMTSLFTKDAKAETYTSLTPKIALDEMNPPLKALRGRELWAAQESAKMNWADIDDAPSEALNKILWWATKGFDKPLPNLKRSAAKNADVD